MGQKARNAGKKVSKTCDKHANVKSVHCHCPGTKLKTQTLLKSIDGVLVFDDPDAQYLLKPTKTAAPGFRSNFKHGGVWKHGGASGI